MLKIIEEKVSATDKIIYRLECEKTGFRFPGLFSGICQYEHLGRVIYACIDLGRPKGSNFETIIDANRQEVLGTFEVVDGDSEPIAAYYFGILTKTKKKTRAKKSSKIPKKWEKYHNEHGVMFGFLKEYAEPIDKEAWEDAVADIQELYGSEYKDYDFISYVEANAITQLFKKYCKFDEKKKECGLD